jgi:hypothetical protein
MDIWGFHLSTVLGATGGAGIAFAAVYGTFLRFEKIQSRKNRLYVSRWLLGLQVPKGGSEEFFIELFNKLLGPKHWSFRCAITSFMLSAFLIVITFFGSYLGFWSSWPEGAPNPIVNLLFEESGKGEGLTSWVVSACLLDYLSLWKTRLFLTRLSAFKSTFASISLVSVDFIITSVLFGLLPCLVMFELVSLHYGVIETLTHSWIHLYDEVIPIQVPMTVASFQSGYYLVALLTSVWLWTYVLASQAVRLLAYIPRFIGFLSKIADVKEHPVRVLGFVAGVLSAAVVILINIL